ncbi:hypothetical protein [Mesorhizobium sp. M0491]
MGGVRRTSSPPEALFRRAKESGLGKAGGHQGIEDYLDTKHVCLGLAVIC